MPNDEQIHINTMVDHFHRAMLAAQSGDAYMAGKQYGFAYSMMLKLSYGTTFNRAFDLAVAINNAIEISIKIQE